MLVHERGSGLLEVRQAAVPREIRAALKRLDPELVLNQQVDQFYGCWLWRVLRRDGDRPAVWLFDWREDLSDPRSRPRPLSHALVEEAAARRLTSRRPQADPLAANDALVARLDEDSEQAMHELAAEAARSARRRSPVARSQGLRRSRDKARNRGEQA